MNSTEAKDRLLTDPDFIYSKRFDNSLRKLLERYPDGTAPSKVIAQALMVTEDELEELETAIITKIRTELRVEVDS